ncbi:hypothetical protein QU41_00105, partial [Bradyrhizobium elkanii]
PRRAKRSAAADVVPALAGAGAPAMAEASAEGTGGAGQALIPSSNGAAQLVDVAQIQGQVHAQAVHRVGELADPMHGLGMDLALDLGDVDQLRCAVAARDQGLPGPAGAFCARFRHRGRARTGQRRDHVGGRAALGPPG